MGEPHQAELGLNVFLLGVVVDVSNINPPAACDLATLVNLVQCKGSSVALSGLVGSEMAHAFNPNRVGP